MPPRFYAPLPGEPSDTVTLSEDESHHLKHVLRLEVGSEVRVFNGLGREWTARVASIGRAEATLEIASEATPVAEPAIRITIAVGVLKGDQMDAVIRDVTMLGAAAVVPLVTAHVAAGRKMPRFAGGHWQRVAVASAKQCGRAVVPTVEPVVPFEELMAREGYDIRLMCVEPSADSVGVQSLSSAAGAPDGSNVHIPRSALVLIGPEGGWSREEIVSASAAGVRLVHLGPRTLRAETAPTVVLSGLWTLWGF